MDPNATLETLRQLCADWENGITRDSEQLAGEFFDAVTALDEWLTRGGFLPRAWEHATQERAGGAS